MFISYASTFISVSDTSLALPYTILLSLLAHIIVILLNDVNVCAPKL